MKIPANKSVAVGVQFTNANGNPAEVQGDVTWESSDTAVATVVVKPDDTKQATIVAGPKAGEATITASADADLGDGVAEVEAVIDVEVVAKGEAVGGEIAPIGTWGGGPGGPSAGNELPGGSGGRPDQGLPGHERPPENATRPEGGRPSNELPSGRPDRPDQGLPGGRPDRPDQGLPGSGARPDQGLPGDQPGIDNDVRGDRLKPGNELPETPTTKPGSNPGRPDAGLPPGATPKKR
jgi:hypothetical protein